MFRELTKILQAPDVPVEQPASNDWAMLDFDFREFPLDFKQFLSLYGTGQIDNFLWILNPFSKNKYLNNISQLDLIREGFHIAEKDFGEEVPSLFPASGGLLPFAITDNGDTVFFKTEGLSSKWSILVTSPRDPEKDVFHFGFSAWLLQTLTKTIKNCCFPSDFPLEKPIFIPYSGS